ncbi:uncharacterized protein LOC127736386 [Mytilus californianus]|uniref:uncharacterized protein LOC127736386 n=1 Tax=Mytilus californianus TaxID=6549 RepID=UPI00224523F9|nr:uncharacterized protein LOC127736386 [Mytilus californianus]
MWLFVFTVLSYICFGFLLDVSSGHAELMDEDLVKSIHAELKALSSNYHNLFLTVQNDRSEIDSLIKQNQDLNQRLIKNVDKMEELITNEEFLNQTIKAFQTLTSEQQRELNKEKSMSIKLTSNNKDLLYRVNREVDFLIKQKHDLEGKINTTEEKMEKLMSEKETSSQIIETLQNITSQQQHELNKAEYKSKKSRVSVASSLTLLNNKLQELTNSTGIGFKNLNGNILKERKLLREEMRKFEKRIKRRINKKLDKIVDGKWSRWIEKLCSVTCGVGSRLRYRQCSNPYPQHGGKNCTGNITEHVTCLQYNPCPVHGAWSVWSETICSVTCGVGTSLRSRNCSNPHPQYGGNNCTGNSIDHVTCTQPNKCPAQVTTQRTVIYHGGGVVSSGSREYFEGFNVTDFGMDFSYIVRFYGNAYIHYDFGKIRLEQQDILVRVQNETFIFQFITSEQNGLIWLDDRQEEDLIMYLAVKDGYLWFHIDEGNGRIQESKLTSRKIKELNDWEWHTFRVDRDFKLLKFYIDEEYIVTLLTEREIQLIGRGDVYLGGTSKDYTDDVITQGYRGGITKILYVKNLPNYLLRVSLMQYITKMLKGNGISSGLDIITPGQAITPRPRPRPRPRHTQRPYTPRPIRPTSIGT